MEKLTKKYGLPTAICMVVGIVIGSGIFFKAQDVLNLTGGNAGYGVLAWLIGGAIMVTFTTTFAVMATKYEKMGGVMDYAEATCGKNYTYFIGWFITTVYYPAMTSVLAWICAKFTVSAFGGEDPETGAPTMILAGFFLIATYAINALSPKLAGKVQVSATVIKMIPLCVIALVGTVAGLVNGTLISNFAEGAEVVQGTSAGGAGVFAAICCTAFAYEGWIIATSINAELKNSKRNLPIALCLGALIVVAAYVLYYVGALGLLDVDILLKNGTGEAFKFFGVFGEMAINFFIIISCLGTLNGLMLASTRGMYSLAARDRGPSPKIFGEISDSSNMPTNSAVIGLLICMGWLLYFVGGQFFGWFGNYAFDSSELPIITIYAFYVPMLIAFMIKGKGTHPVKRFLLPFLSLIGAGIMIAASIFRHGVGNLYYLAVFAVIMAVGGVFFFLNKRAEKKSLSQNG